MSRRLIAVVGLVAQVVFVLSWLVASAWQGPRYSTVRHTISDMYAVTAPHGEFLVITLTLCGAATILFALAALRPALGGGWRSTIGCVLLAVSIYGLGDLLSAFEREGCRLADPGCTPANQMLAGGSADALLSTVGLVCFVAAGFFLAAAMRRAPTWQRWVWPTRLVTIVVLLLLLTIGIPGEPVVGGLLERVLAATGAAGIGALAVGVIPRSRQAP